MIGLGASSRIFQIIDESAPAQSANSNNLQDAKALQTGATQYELEINDLTYVYTARPDKPALKNICCKIAPGMTVAIVGPSGAGKSTLAHLLLRFYEPTSGEILCHGKPLSEYSKEELRTQISAVLQDTHLFSTTIEENIRYGNPQATSEELQVAVEQAALSSFIANLPDGLKTAVGNRGVQLSGGEKQRISIARTLLRNPKILILDEATSSLDSANEELVQQALKNVMTNRTTIIIAHRLSTIQGADLVLVLKNGELVEQGRHDALISSGGLYKSLVEYQLFS
jgi:ABC-type multidrug transport system fused ATPase/permease subunit